MNNRVTLRIHSVKCVDETGGSFMERIGNDEINLSGFGIDPAANTTQVPSFRVNSNFDDGEIQRYSPPRAFVSLNVANGAPFPKTCSVGFLLAEIDGGDFGTKSKEIFTKVKAEVEKKKKEEEAKKKAAMGVANLTGAEIAAIWSVVKPIIIDFVVNKIAGAMNDDLFPLKDVSLTLPDANFKFPGGSNTSAPFTVEFRGHSGIYLMTCDWALS